ncbi:PRTRC system protein B [Flavobacterium beibuense]|nr:PRTRC system protein B [Flavobacterium beibuense]
MMLYHPACALVVFTAKGSASPYIEYYDMDEAGSPVNPHPLSVREAQSLAKALDTTGQAAKAFLKPEGFLPTGVLHIDPSGNGSVLWHTKPQIQRLHFTESLGLESCEVNLPALVWKADRKQLQLFALVTKAKPKANTPLYHAPFFNFYSNGNVCMGNVDIRIGSAASLEEFVKAWESYFFGSYFSHHIDSHNPVKGNLTSLYRDLMDKGHPFPADALVKTRLTVKDLL